MNKNKKNNLKSFNSPPASPLRGEIKRGASITINNLSELSIAAKQLLEVCPDKKNFAFYGEMGVGKTTFIKSICEILGVADTINSPTYSIVNEYQTLEGEKIFHFDFFRIKSMNEAYDMGYEDYFYTDAYCFIEWPEKIEELLPKGYVRVSITLQAEKRMIKIVF